MLCELYVAFFHLFLLSNILDLSLSDEGHSIYTSVSDEGHSRYTSVSDEGHSRYTRVSDEGHFRLHERI